MRTSAWIFGVVFCASAFTSVRAQDGDLLTSSPGGRGYFEAVPLTPGGAVVAPYNLNVGTSAFSLATLNVRGDQLPVNSFWPAFGGGASVCTFRTDVGDDTNQNWDMVRGADHIGRIWHYGNQSAFNVQAMKGPLRLRNKDMDGIRINGNNSSGTVNGFTVNLVGFAALGVGAQMDDLSTNAPWARWHLVHENQGATAPYNGFRPWMRNGMMGTGMSDMFYLGHKYDMGATGTGAEQDDNSNFVAAWFDDVLPTNATYNNFSFRYLGDLGVGGSAGTIEGLEMMRLRPYRNAATDPVQGFVGIGDWVNAAGGPMPEERLDILDRTARIRQLPTSPFQAPTTDDDKVVVVRSDGRLNWCDAAVLTGATDCDWVVGPGATANHLFTASGTAGTANCPDITETVNIGTTSVAAKLHLRNDPAQTGLGFGAIFSNNTYPSPTATSGDQIGISANNTGISGYENYAGHFRAYGGGGTSATGAEAGVWSYAECSTSATNVNGVLAAATETTGATTSNIFGLNATATARTGNPTVYGLWVDAIRSTSGSSYTTPLYGVYARVRDDLPSSETYESHEWAGYFKGHVHVDGDLTVNGTYPPSDDALKINETPLVGVMDIIGQLQPMTYEFDQDAYGFMHLPMGTQAGLIAQQVESTIPNLVKDFIYPAEFDTTGAMEHPEVPYKALNYTGLIPYLVAGMQQQQAEIAQLQAQLDVCCAASDGGMRQVGGPQEGIRKSNEPRLLIHPNPFTNTTNIAVALDHATRVSMTVMGLNGQAVKTLELGEAQPGIFTYTWDTSDMAAGQYVITILLDGKAETAQVVKLAER